MKVITQLKHLIKSYSCSTSKSRQYGEVYCDAGHFGCKIVHARFNFVYALQIDTDKTLKKDFLNTRRNDKFGGSLDEKSTTFRPKVGVHKPNEAFFYKKLSKNIDLLQSMYEMRNAIFVQGQIVGRLMQRSFC